VILVILCVCSISVVGVFLLPKSREFINTVLLKETPVEQNNDRGLEEDDPSISVNKTPIIWGEDQELIQSANESLIILKNTIIKENDPYDLAYRFERKTNISKAITAQPKNYQVGDEREFWVLNTLLNTYTRVRANLQYETSHAYFWIAEDVKFYQNDLRPLAQVFEGKIYPTNREFFGSEKTPGIDNDPHVYILYAHGLGNAAGFFSSTDGVMNGIDEYSNMAEMIYLSADYVDLGEEYANAVLAHEFQHMIQWNGDRNETSWITEGFSELAMYLNGYDPGGFEFWFALEPNLQLTDWPGNDQGDSSPHYGAAFLFMKYYLDRFGENATKSLVYHPQNDIESVDLVLESQNLIDPVSKSQITADEIFRDWTITNLINDGSVLDGRYQYDDYQPPPFATEFIEEGTAGWIEESVKQYGTRYYEFECLNGCKLSIEGKGAIQIIPEDPHSGEYYFWSNKGDESDMTLTQTFDFTRVKGPILFKYYTWFDIERDYDYLYLIATEDGQQWEVLETPSCTRDNPTGANFGCGYSSSSNGWVLETVDLSKFAGKKVTLQFEYITDLAVNGEGLLLDDLEIEAIGYQSDLENDSGGWQAEGFVRIQNKLPQEYLMTLIKQGAELEIRPLSFDKSLRLEVDLPGDSNYYLIICGITRYTRIPAEFRMKVESQ